MRRTRPIMSLLGSQDQHPNQRLLLGQDEILTHDIIREALIAHRFWQDD